MIAITREDIEKIPNKKAKSIIFENVYPDEEMELPIESALFSALYTDIFSPISLPDFPKTAVDGFAFNVDEITSFPAELEISGEIKAGDTTIPEIPEKSAIFIMTGAIVPEKLNAVVRIEDVEIIEGNKIRISKPVPKYNLINLPESEIRKGEKILQKGDILTPSNIALLSHIGIKKVKVYKKPSIGIIITGNEIIEPDNEYIPSYSYNSNKYILTSFLKRILVPARTYQIISDKEEEIKTLLQEAIEENDIIITTGGISRGKYDYVKKVLPNIGVKIYFYATNIKPGSPFIFGKYEKKYVFSLPGYPSALFVNFIEYVFPAIKKICGYKNFENIYHQVELLEDIKTKKNRKDFIRANIVIEKNQLKAIPQKKQETSNFYTTATANALLIADEEKEKYKKGELIKALIVSPNVITPFP
jgi:molybdopterin molybdotransferase